jgi:hypothetical protein
MLNRIDTEEIGSINRKDLYIFLMHSLTVR